MHELLIKGGRIIDPAQNIDAVRDVAVTSGKIDKVASNIPPKEAKKVVDASGKIVTPGLIDIHTHVYDGVLDIGANPDDAGVRQGVTTLMDCGSAGCATFGGFPKYVLPAAKTSVYCLLHIGSFGISSMPELWHPEEINRANTEATIAANPGLIRGVKLRLVGKLVASQGLEVVKIAKETARRFSLPLMVHIGDRNQWVSAHITRDFLPLMEAGDIVSHIYTGLQGGILMEDGEVIPEYVEAEKRGVVLDVAHGQNNLSYAVAKRMIDKGFLPTTLSTDLTQRSITGPVYGLTVTMSEFLALGIPLEKMVPMVTMNSAKAMRIGDRKDGLKPGADADISILEIKSTRWRVLDSHQESLDVEKLITPFLTVKAGELIAPKPVAQPGPMRESGQG